MKMLRIAKKIIGGAILLFLAGCTPQTPQQALPKDAPTGNVPAGMVEVSRLKGQADPKSSESKPSDSAKDNSASVDDKTSASGMGSDIPKSITADGKEQLNYDSSSRNAASGSVNADNNGKTEENSTTSEPQSESSHVQTLENTAITARGENPWMLDAQKVEYDDSNKRVRVKSIVWTLLDKQNNPRLTVRGKAADVNVQSQNVVFDGPVEGSGSNGETLQVNRLVWDSQKQRIIGTHGVRVVRNGTVMTGDNLSASPDLKKLEVSGHVRVSFAPQEGQGSSEV